MIRFGRNGQFSVTQIALSAARIAELQEHMLLMYTGIERDSFEVLRQQVDRTADNESVLCRMAGLAEEGARWLSEGGPICRFGELLHDSWMLKPPSDLGFQDEPSTAFRVIYTVRLDFFKSHLTV